MVICDISNAEWGNPIGFDNEQIVRLVIGDGKELFVKGESRLQIRSI